MRNEKEDELHTTRTGLYVLGTLIFVLLSLYVLSLFLQEGEEHELNCYAIQDIFNDLEQTKKHYVQRGIRSTVIKAHNQKLQKTLESAEQSGCFKHNIKHIERYLMIPES